MPDSSPIPNITSIESTDIVRVWRYVDALGGYRMFEISGANLSASFDGGGSLSVTDGSTTVDSVTALDFSGATVTDGGAGEAEITVSGGGSSGIVRIASGVVTTPTDAITFPMDTSIYSEFDVTLQQFYVNSTASNYLTFAFGDEGVDGNFYKDDVTFVGYIIGRTIGASPSTMTYGQTEDGYGYLSEVMADESTGVQTIRLHIDPGSATSWATCDSSVRMVSPNGGLSPVSHIREYTNLFYTDFGPMNAFRVCGPVPGAQITAGKYFVEARLKT